MYLPRCLKSRKQLALYVDIYRGTRPYRRSRHLRAQAQTPAVRTLS